ncbi:protein Teyrha-meyrha [Musca domestica]|uniref:Protein Teyrha-meyrha n=1 Tax=Musca domestica TaxID=7370 RepID=A0A1I8MH38_MUSDO|nr:protein Teyrha-meyrha [Musca domestica]
MESNAFGSSHIPSQALVVLSEAASGLHEALRGQRPFPARLPDAKDLHNMSLVGSYGSHLLHTFHPHLLQTLNHNMLAANGSAAAASYFASERAALGKPSVLGNFQLPSAFSPPKYIGISLDQNLFNGNDSFRTDSASPTCTSHESLEGSNDYDAEKGESPRSNASDPRDLRHTHRSDKPSTSCASSMAAVSAAAAAAVASIASSQAAAAASSATVSSHMSHHPHHPHAPPHHVPHHLPPLSAHHHHHHPNSSLLAAASMSHSLGLGGPPGLRPPPGHIPDMCPVCGIKLSADEWNSHFLTELDRLYKLSSGMERSNLQATYMFAQPCPSQENAIRTSHNRWETFQRIRNNRQNRLRIKVRKRKYGDMYFMENMFCNSCPICKRKYALEVGGKLPDDENKQQDEIETVDVESCNDDVPDSNSELSQVHHAHMPALSGSSSHSSSHSSSGGGGGGASTPGGANLHNSNSQPGKLDGILYRTANCAISKDNMHQTAEEDISTNVATTTSGSNSSNSSSAGSSSNWTEAHNPGSNINSHTNAAQGHISVKNVSELSSTTHHYYNADSCNEERSAKDMSMDTCNNDSDEDVIVDDDDSIKMASYNKKRKYEEAMVGSSRISDNPSPVEERPRSEPQVTSTETTVENPHNNNNNNNTTKYTAFEDLRSKHMTHHGQQLQMQHHQPLERDSPNGHGHGQVAPQHPGLMPGLAAAQQQQQQLDSKVGNSSDIKPDNEDDNKCFICKTGIKDFASDTFLRGRNFYFHQSCANVMSSYRLNKELQQQQQQQQHLHQQTEVGSSDKPATVTQSQSQPTSQQHVDNGQATHKES